MFPACVADEMWQQWEMIRLRNNVWPQKLASSFNEIPTGLRKKIDKDSHVKEFVRDGDQKSE